MVEYIGLQTYLDLHNTEIVKEKYLQLLRELTYAPDIPDDMFLQNINQIHKTGQIIIGVSGDEIVCSGTIIIEPKIIHGCKNVGHIEDIVVRGRKIGCSLLQRLVAYASKNNCYKVILDCKEQLESFYKKTNFSKHGVQMSLYLE